MWHGNLCDLVEQSIRREIPASEFQNVIDNIGLPYSGIDAHADIVKPSPLSPTFDGITYNDFVLSFDFSYQANVWGRVRRTVESYGEQAQASVADLARVNLSMRADLALDYFQAPQPRC